MLGNSIGDKYLRTGHGAHKGLDSPVVVVMEVREHDGIEAQHMLARQRAHHRAVWARVDKDGMPTVLHEDGVALPDVEDADPRRRTDRPRQDERTSQAGRREEQPSRDTLAWNRPRHHEGRSDEHEGGRRELLIGLEGNRRQRHSRKAPHETQRQPEQQVRPIDERSPAGRDAGAARTDEGKGHREGQKGACGKHNQGADKRYARRHLGDERDGGHKADGRG